MLGRPDQALARLAAPARLLAVALFLPVAAVLAEILLASAAR